MPKTDMNIRSYESEYRSDLDIIKQWRFRVPTKQQSPESIFRALIKTIQRGPVSMRGRDVHPGGVPLLQPTGVYGRVGRTRLW